MDKTDMSNILQHLSSQMGGDYSNLSSLINMMHTSDSDSNSTVNNSDNSSNNNNIPGMPDIETIMKIKKVIDSMKTSSSDPSITLLSSLKPYLRDEKKLKLDEYIKILNISKVISTFTDMEGDSK